MQINRLQLANALKRLASIIPSRAMIPAMECVLIKSKDDKLTLSGTNLDQYITTRIPLDETEPFACAVHYRQLQAIANSIDSERVELSIAGANLNIKGGNAKYRLPIIDASEFPPPPAFSKKFTHETPSKTLHDALYSVLPSVSDDTSRFLLNSLLLDFPLNKIRTVATDGRRLSIHGPTNAAESYSLLPKTAIKAVIKAVMEVCQGQGDVEIDAGGNIIQFRFSTCTILSKLVDGTYPDFGRVIPKDNTLDVSIEPGLFRNAIARAKIILSNNMVVRLCFSYGLLTVESSERDLGESSETIEIDNETEFSFACNPDYLLAILPPHLTDPVSLAFNPNDASLNPVLITIGETKHIIMPIRVV